MGLMGNISRPDFDGLWLNFFLYQFYDSPLSHIGIGQAQGLRKFVSSANLEGLSPEEIRVCSGCSSRETLSYVFCQTYPAY